MNLETVREWLHRNPFEPFIVKLSNGDAYEVHHRDFVALGKNRIAVYNSENDSFAHVALIHINNIEALQNA